jgi:ribonuclease HI
MATVCCAGGYPNWSTQLPTLKTSVSGHEYVALLDSGCTRSIVSPGVAKFGEKQKTTRQRIVMMNGESVLCSLSCVVLVVICGVEIKLDCLVAQVLPEYDMLLGMDAVSAMGGVTIEGNGKIWFKKDRDISLSAAAKTEEIEIKDCDFHAKFSEGKWIVEWNWVSPEKAPTIENQVSMYRVHDDSQQVFEDEVQEWIDNGWLQVYQGEFDGVIPLMAVVQPNKDKVRPVLDYRELNQYVSSHTAGSEVCGEKLRLWRKMGEQVSTIDLRKAYLQIHIAPHLWKFQVVHFKGKNYCLTRLGFGLNVAPKIMCCIVNKVLSMNEQVRSGTDSYVDDIIVNEKVVDCKTVIELLEKYGLVSKPAEPLVGSRVLGLRLSRVDDKIMWSRDNKLKTLADIKTKRDVFSLCGQLIGHFPVASWLRPACSFLKRQLSDHKWEDAIDQTNLSILIDIVKSVSEKDPVAGAWAVPTCKEGVVWCDASSLAIGVCIEINGEVVEDASWLRKANDSTHINLAELEALLKGMNLALKWGLTKVKVITDSATVYAWVSSTLTQDRRIKTHGLSEALVRRRLDLFKNLISECDLNVQIELVKSQFNKADCLTRVPKKWLARINNTCSALVSNSQNVNVQNLIKEVHSLHHFGVSRTLFTVKRCHPDFDVSKQEVERVVKSCKECLSIDPSSIKWEPGHLDCEETWYRLAIDVTHYGLSKYLTIIDCGPSRFCVWRRISNETGESISKVLLEIFAERGPPTEVLMDNSKAFHCEKIQQLCEQWSVKRLFRCVNRPSGNGIVERVHRTIKRMVARSKGTIQEMVYWYNFAPKKEIDYKSSPSSQLYSYNWRCKGEPVQEDEKSGSKFSVGEKVYVKPNNPRCTSIWQEGVVTRQLSPTSIEVNGMPRHIADIRRVSGSSIENGVDTTGACA